MIYTFTVVSDEVEDFVREIKIQSDATFLELHKIILDTCSYKDDQMRSFFICDESWEKEKEVTLEDMGSGLDEDILTMAETRLEDLVEDEGQRLLYVFDPMTDRVFFIELSKVEYNKSMGAGKVTRSKGNPPRQTIDFDEAMTTSQSLDMDEDFLGSDGFDDEEIDPEGFEITDGEF